MPKRLLLQLWSPAYSLRGGSCIGGSTVCASRAHSRFPRLSCGTAANVDRGVARIQKIHQKPGAHGTGRLQNSRRGQSGLLEEILYPFVGAGAAAGCSDWSAPLQWESNFMSIIESCCKRLRNAPSRTVLEPRIFRKPSLFFACI